jgi:hypothetical protein
LEIIQRDRYLQDEENIRLKKKIHEKFGSRLKEMSI